MMKVLGHLADMGQELIFVLNSALFPLIREGDLDMVDRLLKAKADINARENGHAVLDAALGSDAAGAVGMVPWLVKKGAVTLERRQWRQKELFDAAERWDPQAVECL